MTDEELRVRAIQELEFYKKDDTFMLADITVDLAIKALKQEPCDNAVSRQDVLDLAKKGVLISNGNYESVCKAINEIPAVNPQPCEDAISRQAVLDLVNADWKYEGLETHIVSLPPVTPQTKTGHWITKDGKEQGYDIAGIKTWYIQIMCSECGFIKTAIEGRTVQYHYCPSCGARMESDKNG